MTLIDKVLNDPLYKAFADKVSDDERKELEESIIDMLAGANQIYSIISDAASTEETREQLLESLEKVISPEGLKKWQEIN